MRPKHNLCSRHYIKRRVQLESGSVFRKKSFVMNLSSSFFRQVSFVQHLSVIRYSVFTIHYSFIICLITVLFWISIFQYLQLESVISIPPQSRASPLCQPTAARHVIGQIGAIKHTYIRRATWNSSKINTKWF